MLDIEDYDSIFPDGGYSNAIVGNIHENQNQLGGRTFFERLLELLHIKCRLRSLRKFESRQIDLQVGRRIYPPTSERDLRELHNRICDAQITLHYKHCLVFYLLKDLSPAHHGDTELSTQFAQDVHLEKRFWTFIEGIWELDHLQFETAVGNLTHPSIIPTFPDEILLALLNRYSNNRLGTDILPLAYYNCAKPPLTSEAVKIQFVKYMTARNVTEAYYWIRARPEFEHKPLLEALVEQTLDSQNWNSYGGEDAYPPEEKTMDLVNLPFDEEEEQWLEKFLTEGKGRTLHGAGDTVSMRRIATGNLHGFAVEKVKQGRKHDGVNWEVLKDGVKRGLGPRKDEEAFVG